MQIESNSKLPHGFPLAAYKGRNYYEPMPQLKKVFDLRHSVFDKLEAIPQICKATHSNIKNIFSSLDIAILEKISETEAISSDTSMLIKQIVRQNYVKYIDAPFKKCQEIINLKDIKSKYPQETYKTFTKWFNLAGNNPKGEKWSTIKTNTIISNKIYMPFPIEFNDRFDCQLHLNHEELLKLADNNHNALPMVKLQYLMTKYCYLINSFSLNTPESIESNHMWGLYGDSGKGIAVTYELDNLFNLVYRNNMVREPEDILLFNTVDYRKNHNPSLLFENYLKKCLIPNQNNLEDLYNFFDDFALTKTYQWQFEKELRFYVHSSDAYKNFPARFTTASEQNCLELENWLQESITNIDHEKVFILPKQITLGWNCDKNDSDIQRIIKYGKQNLIQIHKLDGFINYSSNMHYFTSL